jgi:hypothetical protein
MHAVLELTRVSEHAGVPDDHVLANVAAGTKLAVSPDPGRAFDHRAGFQRRAFINEHILADERPRRHLRANLALQPELQIGLDPRQCRPHGRVIRKQDAMLRVGEVEIVACKRFKHVVYELQTVRPSFPSPSTPHAGRSRRSSCRSWSEFPSPCGGGRLR